jgi:hypothetical protein
LEKKKLSDLLKQDRKVDLKMESIIKPEPVTNPLFTRNILDEINQEMGREKAKTKRKEEEYRAAVLNTLQGIEKNTALLTEMTVLLKENNSKQDQVFGLITEILAIMKASSKEEATSKFNDVMKKIAAAADGVNSVQSLYTMASTVYTAAQAMF